MSTPYDYITINTPTGGTSTTYTGTQISVNTPAVSDVTKAEVSFTSSQSLNGYSYPWADGTGTNQITGSNRMRDWEITGSGDVVNFYPYQKSSPQYLSRLTTTIVPQQDLNGYDHPWAGGAGKNKFPALSATQTISGVTATKNSDGSVTLSGTATATLYFDVDTNFNTTAVAGYYFSGIPSPCPYGNGVRFRISNSTSDRTALNDYYVSTSGVVTGGVINDNGSGKCLSIRVASGTAITTPLTLYPMISAVQGDTFAPYENICPITGFTGANIYVSPTTSAGDATTYTVSFDSAGTVYGGTLDVVTGSLTVDRQSVTLDGTESWSKSSLTACDIFLHSNSSYIVDSDTMLSSFRFVNASTTQGIGDAWIGSSNVQLRIGFSTYGTTDLATFKQWLSDNPVQLVRKLATPLTYQLTATQVAMITGNNYIWTNCGTITDTGYKLTSSNNDTLTYLYAPNAGLCTGKMPTTIGLGFTYNYLSFEYYSTQAVDIDVYICGTDAKWYDTTYNRTKYVKWDTFSLPAKTSYTKYTLPTRSISLSDLTEGSGDVNSVYFEIVPTTNTPTYPMRIQHVQFDHNSASTTYVPSQNRCTYSGASSVTLYKRSAQSSSYESSYYKYLNSTVYNGSFEYITGKVTKTYVSITLNSSDLTWAVYNDSSTSRAFRATITNMKSLSHSSYDSTKCFCTHARWTTSSESLSFGSFYYSYGYVYFPDYSSKRFNSVDEFTAWLDLQESRGTPVTILYPLSTPTETTVSTTTIKTLAGQNYFDTSSTAANRLPLTMTVLQSSFMLPRPLNFAVQREDIYAGQYTTCTGATRADCIGWKYSDMTWSWDGLKQSDVEKLCGLTGECTLIFDDPSGDTIEESFIRTSVVSMRCRNKFEDEYWWTGVSCSISFIDSHTD